MAEEPRPPDAPHGPATSGAGRGGGADRMAVIPSWDRAARRQQWRGRRGRARAGRVIGCFIVGLVCSRHDHRHRDVGRRRVARGHRALRRGAVRGHGRRGGRRPDDRDRARDPGVLIQRTALGSADSARPPSASPMVSPTFAWRLRGPDHFRGPGRRVQRDGRADRSSARTARALLAEVTHELRTPFTVVAGGIEAMLDGVHPMDEDHPPAARRDRGDGPAHRGPAGRSRWPRPGAAAHREPVDLAALANDVVGGTRPAASRAGIALRSSDVAPVPYHRRPGAGP